ncbi:hypothetical protein SDC9_178295 [bioreactor metagenome]|uniref:Uncharacterized protein n=1 Tax=bioreactor metagenome TaxID=1076179 RepID=A0A645H3D5_9ZZZZ
MDEDQFVSELRFEMERFHFSHVFEIPVRDRRFFRGHRNIIATSSQTKLIQLKGVNFCPFGKIVHQSGAASQSKIGRKLKMRNHFVGSVSLEFPGGLFLNIF